MFSKKKRNAAPPPPAIKTPSAPPPIPPGPPPAAPFSQQAHGRNISTGTTTTVSSGNVRETPLVSPLQMTFEFELPPRSPFSDFSKPSLESLRPKTSDGLGASSKKSNVSLAPPLLPPIPRVASRNEKGRSTVSYESGGSDSEGMARSRRKRDDSENGSVKSAKSTKSTASRKSFKVFEMTLDELNNAPSLPSRPASSGGALLPPIPRDASRKEKAKSTGLYESGGSDSEAMTRSRKERDDSDNISVKSAKSTKSTASRKSFKIFEMTRDELNRAPSLPSRPVSSGGNTRPSTSTGTPKMEGTLFPKSDPPVLPPLRTVTGPASATMDRSFVDSRDRAFQPAVPKMPAAQLHGSNSTPDLSSTLRGPTQNFSQKSPLSPQTPTSATPTTSARSRAESAVNTRKNLQKKSSRPELQGKRALSNFSGTTARSKESSRTEVLTPTVGTPYGQTSPSFPLPQHVATRPKTAGAASTIAGISVPTHHTTSQPASRPETSKAEKRKTKFLNPLAMFSRRKSAQNEVEVQKEMAAQEAALARQKDVAAAGVRKVPNDFDPRIKGKVVHDFSAPNRQSMRSFTFNDVAEGLQGHQSRLQTANSAPVIPALHDGANVRQSTFSGNSSTSAGTRKSIHAPVFVEHLSDTPMGANRMNAERAESLANRDFLQRASHVSSVSQESAVLPPFARRSQVMDPLQASHYIDDGSKRSSDPSSSSGATDKNRDSGVSSFSSVSPVTARNSAMPPADPARQSMSPISPTSPSRAGFGAAARPKSMASSLLRESTVFPDAEQEYPSQQSQPLQPNLAIDQNTECTAKPSTRNPPPPPLPLGGGGTLSPPPPPGFISPSIPPSPAFTNSSTNNSTPAEEQVANTVRLSKPPVSPARIVEKLASAVGHTKRSTSSKKQQKPKHQASNASRFSFQLAGGGSVAEELALEEKARKMRSGVSAFSATRGANAGGTSEEDEDEYFDEDAMDDLDEMELREEPDEAQMQALPGAQQAATLPPQIAVPPRQFAMPPPGQASPGITPAGLQLMISESDGENMSGEDEESASEGGYYDFVDYGSISHSRGESITTDQSRKPSVVAGGGSKVPSPLASPLSPRFPLRADTPPAQSALSREAHAQAQQAQHQRIMSDDSALTVNTKIQPDGRGNAAFDQEGLLPSASVPGGIAGSAQPRSGFYTQPTAAGYSPNATEKVPLASSRDSGNAENRNTVDASKGDLGASPGKIIADKHKSVLSSSTMSSSDEGKRPFSDATIGAVSSSRSSAPRTGSTGLGLSGFSDFHFSDSPENSRPPSKLLANENRLTGDSETIPQHAGWFSQHRKRGSSPLIPSSSERNSKSSGLAVGESHKYTGSVGKNLQARKSSLAEFATAADAGEDGDDEDDDMYFDGGGFEGDLQTGKLELGERMNEEVFDDERFQRGQPMLNGFAPPRPQSSHGLLGGIAGQSPMRNSFSPPPQPPHGRPLSGQAHHRDMSGGGMSLGSDGPYPSFAMPNPIKARQRDSQMMLEDLVLPANPPPNWKPLQRNPSEDAKRLGLSSRVPPLPPQPGNMEAQGRVERSLQAYHAALAEAANRAASEGRFLRMPSSASTQRSASVYSKAPDAADNELGRYEEEEPLPSDAVANVNGNGTGTAATDLQRNATQQTNQTTSTLSSALNASTTYSPELPKMSFDFGFDSTPFMDSQNFRLDDFNTNTNSRNVISNTTTANMDHFNHNNNNTSAVPSDSSAFNDAYNGEDDDEDDIVAAANAEALASDDAGFYGQEFGFFAKARPGSGEGLEASNGGFFGDDGDDALLRREKSLREPNLTPITERSEFSTRNSFIGGLWGPPSAGLVGPGGAGMVGGGVASPALARLPVSPLMEGAGDITSFDQLRKLRLNAFGGSNASLGSNGAGSHRNSAGAGLQQQGYFPAAGMGGGSPIGYGHGYSPASGSEGSGGSAPGSAHPGRMSNGFGGAYDSPITGSASAGAERMSFSSPLTTEQHSFGGNDVTPRKPPPGQQSDGRPESPMTARKASKGVGSGHSRQSSGADSVTYVRESYPDGQPRWVLERRRTSELGLSELVGREVVQGGWI